MPFKVISVALRADSGGLTTGLRAAAGEVTRFENSVNRSGKATQEAGRMFTVAKVGALGLAAAVAYSVKSAADFQSQMNAVKAVTGASSSEMAQLSAKALQLGKDTVFSASDSADAIGELAKAGVSVQDIMHGAADATVALAAAGGISLPEAATIAANAMNAFNLQASQLPHVADLIAGAANASAIDVGEFGQSFQQVAAVAHLAGLSIDDTTTAIAEMGNAGIKGSDAGTSLKTMLQYLQPQSKQAAEEMKKLGIMTADGGNKFYDSTGKAKSMAAIAEVLHTSLAGLTKQQQQQALATLFGTDAVRAAAIVAQNGAAGFNKLNGAIEGTKAAQVAGTRMQGLSGAMQNLQGSVETAAIQFGQHLLPALTTTANFMASAVVPAVSGVTNVLVDHAGVVAAAAGAYGAIKYLPGWYASLSGVASPALSSIKNAFMATNTVMAQTGSIVAPNGMLIPQFSQIERQTFSMSAGFKSLASSAGSFVASGAGLAVATAALYGFEQGLDTLLTTQKKVDSEAASFANVLKSKVDPTMLGSRAYFDKMQDSLLRMAAAQGKSADSYTDVIGGAKAYNTVIDELGNRELDAEANARRVAAAYGLTNDEVLKLAHAAGIDLSGSYDDVTKKLNDYMNAQRAGNPAIQAVTQYALDEAGGFKDAAQAAGDLKNAIDKLAGSHSTLVGDQDAVAKGILTLKDSLDSSSSSFTDNTVGAINNREALRSVTDNIVTLAKAQIDAGVPYDKVTQQVYLQSMALLNATGATGKNRDMLAALIAQLVQMPPAKATNVTTPGAATSRGQVGGLLNTLNALHDVNIKVTVWDYASQILADIHHAAADLISLGFSPQGAANTIKASRYATGGLVRGPGGPTGDRIPAMLSDREYVQPAHTVAREGVAAMDALRAGRATIVPKFAGGGLVDVMSLLYDATPTVRNMWAAMGSGSLNLGGGASRWAGVALQALRLNGASAMWLPNVLGQIQFESGGNANAVQTVHDVNWPNNLARGLIQVTPGTFIANHVPGTSWNIMDPLANLAAGIHHAIFEDPGGLAYLNKGHGYKLGGVKPPGWGIVGERGAEAIYTGTDARIYPASQTRGMLGNTTIIASGAFSPSITVQGGDSHEVVAAVRREIDSWSNEVVAMIDQRTGGKR